ncbi:GGDEF domain-containing protein [Leptospira sp. 201903071]|uniref:GGDEF domain-containing phosphodiesterase n=1 Tax=Leptospira ainazelensis TaxID=2810034 RepID=UPI0019631E25|nr:GGDEF domain-containing phosphodiesterase [Leptospira ainazelensis]MBM9501182.1 GGDEF domain-containing protein [Leptospira ainazelensis]
MGTPMENISPSLQKSLLYFSDQSIEAIVVLDREWKTIYSNSKFQKHWSTPEFRISFEKLIPILSAKKTWEKEFDITSILEENGIEFPFFSNSDLKLHLTIHDLEHSYMIRFRPEVSIPPKKEFDSSYFDKVTNLPNKKYFLKHFQELVSQNSRNMDGHFVFLVSFTNPDAVASQEENSYFDSISVKVAERLKKYLNPKDSVFKIEGDNFLISCTQIDSESKAEWFCDCIVLLFNFPFSYGEREFHLNVNIGYSRFEPESGSDMNAIRILKESLHRSFMMGPNSHFYYDRNAISATSEKAKIEIDLRKVLNRNELEIHFQPIVNMKENRIFSMETLVRWNHPQKGKLLPGSFITIAENSSFIKTIGEWMIWETFRYYENSILESKNISLSLNISPKQLGDKNIVPLLKEASAYYKIQPDRIILEIIENSFDSCETQIGKVVNSLRDFGFKFALDDFGKGYSSLGRLIHLPIDYIKLDKIFLFNYFQTSTRTIITSLVNLVQAMGKSIIVEGVENETQHNLLQELNCDFGQGYFYSYPLEILQAEELVLNEKIFTV